MALVVGLVAFATGLVEFPVVFDSGFVLLAPAGVFPAGVVDALFFAIVLVGAPIVAPLETV